MRRIALVLALAALAAPPTASAFTKTDLTLTMSDGVSLAATIYVPGGPPPAGGRPAVLMLHGLGESRTYTANAVGRSLNTIAETELAPQGYVALTFDARGHGDSGGVVAIDGPREIQDVRELFDWLSSRPGVDPSRIGAYGYSYGGGAVWRAAVEGVPFAAIEPGTTWTDLYQALLPQDFAKQGVVLGFYQSIAARLDPSLDVILKDALAGQDLGRVRAFAADRSSRQLLSRLTVPTFMLQGRRDFAFDLEHGLAAYRLLRGPKRLYLADFGHAPSSLPPGELDYVLPEARAWFDRFLKGEPNGIDLRPPIELAPDPWTGKTFSYAGVPARKTLSLAFPGRAEIGARGKVARTRALPRRRLETFGRPVVRVSLASGSGWPHIVAVLSALTPRGKEIVVSGGGTRVRLGNRPKTVTIRLLSQVTAIPPRSRLRLTLAADSRAQSAGNLLYVASVPRSAMLSVGRAGVTLPVLARPVSTGN